MLLTGATSDSAWANAGNEDDWGTWKGRSTHLDVNKPIQYLELALPYVCDLVADRSRSAPRPKAREGASLMGLASWGVLSMKPGVVAAANLLLYPFSRSTSCERS